VRGVVPEHHIGKGVAAQELTEEDQALLRERLAPYCEVFDLSLDGVLSVPFRKLVAVSTRPHGRLYAYLLIFAG